MKRKLAGLAALLTIGLLASGTVVGQNNRPLTATILYDNYASSPSCQTDWGFSCLVRGTERTILFDAGTRGDTFLANAAALKVDLSEVDIFVLSHYHGDHAGGLDTFLSKNKNITIYAPDDPGQYAALYRERMEKAGAKVIAAPEPIALAEGVLLTGTMGGEIKEQALVLKTRSGAVVITGCAHPGIVPILEQAGKLTGTKVALVFGGFHLLQKPAAELDAIVRRFRELGVQKVAASHCTGDRAIEAFRRSYGKDFLEIGVGKIIEIEK